MLVVPDDLCISSIAIVHNTDLRKSNYFVTFLEQAVETLQIAFSGC